MDLQDVEMKWLKIQEINEKFIGDFQDFAYYVDSSLADKFNIVWFNDQIPVLNLSL